MALANAINIRANLSSADALTTLTKIDTDNGSSEYVLNVSSSSSLRFKIQNLVTKENAPVGSRRVQLRFAYTKVQTDGSERTSFASFVVSVPRDASFTTEESLAIVKGLVDFLHGHSEGSNTGPDGTEWDLSANAGPALVARLLQGEV